MEDRLEGTDLLYCDRMMGTFQASIKSLWVEALQRRDFYLGQHSTTNSALDAGI